ncbi:MAG: DUF4199 domain-containing protein [Bacteroidota bacterium]
MQKLIIRYGVYGGLIIVAYSMLVFIVYGDIGELSDRQFQFVEALGFLRYVILFIALFMAMRAYSKDPGAQVGWWPVVRVGILVTLIIAVLVALLEVVYISSYPSFYADYAEIYLSRAEARNPTPSELAVAKRSIENYSFLASPILSGAFYLVETTVVGFVASMATGYFLKKKA